MPIVLSSAYPLHVVTTGDDRRPPLLLINPLGTTVDFWEPMLEILESRNWAIRFDLRGHGGSTGKAVDPYSVDDIAADAIAVLDALEIPRANIFGSSFGGLVAATVAGAAPERVKRLVLASTAVRLGSDAWWKKTSEKIVEFGLAGVVDDLDDISFSEEWRRAVPDRREAARAMLLDVDPLAYLAGSEAVRNADLGAAARRIRASTLVVIGEEDPVLRHYPASDLLGLIQDSEALQVSGARHQVLLEQPDLIAQVVNEFLFDPDGS